MRIRLLSDLHLEFRPDWRQWVDSLDNDCDVLVLAGDIATKEIEDVLEAFAKRFANIYVVAGNHEYYGSSVDDTRARFRRAYLGIDAVWWLDLTISFTQRRRLLGATLWFEKPPTDESKWAMSDFTSIRSLEPWVYDQNRLARQWLAANLQEGDIVITHHLPSARCVHPKFIGSPLNRFFLGCMTRELDDLIEDRKPAAWLFGHTHESTDIRIGKTRVVSNPYGYHGHETNPHFNPSLTIEV